MSAWTSRIDGELLPISMLGLRVLWIWPWLALLAYWIEPEVEQRILPSGIVLGLPIAAYLTGRIARSFSDWMNEKWGKPPSKAEGFLLVASGLLLLPVLFWRLFYADVSLGDPEWIRQFGLDLTQGGPVMATRLIAVFASSFLWVSAVLDAEEDPDQRKVWATFGTGIIAWVALVVVLQLVGGNEFVQPVGYLIGFFALGFWALGRAGRTLGRKLVATPGVLGMPTALVESAATGRSAYWAGASAVTAAVLVTLGVLVGALIAPDDVGSVLSLVRKVLETFFQFIVLCMFWIWKLLRPIASFFKRQATEEPEEKLEEGEEIEESAPDASVGMDDIRFDQISTLAGVVLTVLVIAYLLYVVSRRFRARVSTTDNWSHESILSSDLIKIQLGSAWERWKKRFRRKPAGGRLSLEGEEQRRRRVREIYRLMLDRLAGVGWVRHSPETAHEWSKKLARSSAGLAVPLNTITNGYVIARYGAEAPSGEVVSDVEAAWNQLQNVIDDQVSAEPQGLQGGMR